MKMPQKNTENKIYISPVIELVKLDNEISLVLQSEPPLGPEEIAQATQFNQTNPFKNSSVNFHIY